MNNFGSPRSTIHSYTDGVVVQSIGGTQVSRIFANGNTVLGIGIVDNGNKLEIEGSLKVNTIDNATTDTDRFLVSDLGVIKYRTGTELRSDIGAGVGSVTSVGLTMPSAFSVANSPVTGSGTLAVTGAGVASQYVRGDGTLADFPTNTGGGSSVSYYLNGSVSQGTIGGVAYRELSEVPIFGAGTDISIAANGYIASFITDVGDPALLNIPAGNWNFETYFSASSGGGTPTFYVELYRYDGTTFTLIASSSGTPELISFGTNIQPYFSTLAVPQTALALTDRLAIRYYVVTSGRTITLHTEDNHLCQVITTFSNGLTALNGLTEQVQYFQVGTSGTDFNIVSSVATHTFNLPTASATNRGALSSADWITFNSKMPAITFNAPLFIASGGDVGITQASGSTNGFLSSTDWNTFNNKQPAGNYVTTDTSQTITASKSFTQGFNLASEGGTNQLSVFRNTSSLHTGSAGSNIFGFNSANNIYFGKGLNNGGVLQWNNTTLTRYYTLPDADGTIALTSNLGAYLPLAGGTLTGALGGTSLNFSGDIQTATRLISATGGQQILINANNGGTTNRIESVGTLPLALVSAAAITMAAGGTTPQITLATTGAVTLTGALNGTSAVFSSASANQLTLNGGTTIANRLLVARGTDDSSQNLLLGWSGITVQRTSVPLSSPQTEFSIIQQGSDASRTVFNIASTGAATFSSSVTAGGDVLLGFAANRRFGVDLNSGEYFYGISSNSNARQTRVISAAADANLGISFETGNTYTTVTPKMTITSAGNVGIGTASPATALDVNGTINVRTNGFQFGRITTNNVSGDTGGLNLQYIESGTFKNGIVLNGGGNVGIGTASPAYLLDIQSTSATLRIRNITAPATGGTSSLLFEGINNFSGTSQSFINSIQAGNSGSTQLVFGTSGSSDATATERMRITSSGNVGIGTASPFEKLVVTQTTNNSSSVGFFTNASTGTSYGPIITAGTNSSDAAFRLFNQGASASYFQVRGDGLAIMPPLISSFTTGSAANMFVSPGDGAIYRSTSSIKYKKNVEDYDKGLTEVMQMRPVFYEGISESDEGKIFAGLIAEEVNDLGLTEFVQYAEDGSPDSLAYQNMVALLIKSIQELKTEIDSLKNQIK
jgi:hypothetical protein